MAHEAGKGSKSRPFSVSQQEYDTRWDAIFSRDIKEDKQDEREDKITRNNEETQAVSQLK